MRVVWECGLAGYCFFRCGWVTGDIVELRGALFSPVAGWLRMEFLSSSRRGFLVM